LENNIIKYDGERLADVIDRPAAKLLAALRIKAERNGGRSIFIKVLTRGVEVFPTHDGLTLQSNFSAFARGDDNAANRGMTLRNFSRVSRQINGFEF
jgi:hypothetical protein